MRGFIAHEWGNIHPPHRVLHPHPPGEERSTMRLAAFILATSFCLSLGAQEFTPFDKLQREAQHLSSPQTT